MMQNWRPEIIEPSCFPQNKKMCMQCIHLFLVVTLSALYI